MRASYTRLFPDEDGVSHFEEVAVELTPGFAVPPAEPLHFAEFARLGQCRWVGGASDWKGDAPHPVPHRMLVIPIRGEVELTAGDGTARRFTAGDVIVAEDTWGSGHCSRITSAEESLSLFIELSDTSTG
jgi:hypothetical protein